MWPLAEGRSQPGVIRIEDEGSRRVLCLRGDLDSAVVARFRELRRSEPVLVDEIDADGVSFISSTGLAMMITCVEASFAAGRSPVLRASSHAVDRLLQLSGMDDLFPRAHGTPEQAGPRG
jgi:anti-anti-sigma factor